MLRNWNLKNLDMFPEKFISPYKSTRCHEPEDDGQDFYTDSLLCGVRGSVVVKALCYKPEGRGFDTRRGDKSLLTSTVRNFSLFYLFIYFILTSTTRHVSAHPQAINK
jgi:hypothetical protein